MKKNLNSWKGCFTAVITPFKKNGDLDRKAFCRNLELLVEEGLDGVVIAGCTGESWLLSDEEKKELFSNRSLGISRGMLIIKTGSPYPSHK